MQKLNRRQWLQTAAAAGIGVWAGTRSTAAFPVLPNDKLNVACIGIGGRGRANLNALAKEKDVQIVALCDVDDERAGDAYMKFPRAKKFYDYRRLFDEMGGDIDAVVISTPDHTHYHPAVQAMQLGKHCYCEKPLAHSVWEVRRLTELARQKKLATQLGVQRHAHANVHRVVEVIRSGAIGQVLICHAWVGGDRGMPELPGDQPPAPEHLKWDLWLGPAKARPYHPSIAPYGWRFWWDYGTGETGNWGCHVLDLPYWALDLKYPERVEASGPPVDAERSPRAMQVRFDFPERPGRTALMLYWHHAKDGPEILRRHKLPHFETGVLFIGAKGMLLADFDKYRLFPEAEFADFKEPPRSIPDSPGFHREWVNACKGGEAATCHFDYSGPMTETVLLGNLAYRAGAAFNWDSDHLKALEAPQAEPFIKPDFREGWDLASS